MKFLNVAEKNDAAKNIAQHLSRGTSRRKTLEREVRSCTGLIIWTDCDREGENIGFEIIEVCTAVKSNLRIFRAKFSEITGVSVWRALQNLEQPNKNISDAVDVRQELDLRIGAAFTRFQTLRLQKVFPRKLAESLVSYGSCQFPTLGFVVERYRAVENFVSEPFWKLRVNHTMNNLSVDFAWERVRLFDQSACQLFHDICIENPLAKVCEVKTKPKGDPNWGSFAQNILDSGGPTPRQGNKSDKAHPPIHPTKYTNSLSGNEQRLYEFIVRSFLACCSKDAQGQETTVSIDIANEKFHASGLMITARNYLEVYPYDKWSSKEIHVYEHRYLDGNTSPPNLLTEADLIALMEKHGIETIKNRSYVALADAIHFVPGLLGMGLVEGYDAMGLTISKPHLRAQLEADLKAISEGRKQPQQVLAEQIAKYKEVYQTVAQEANKIDAALAERFREQPNEYVPSTESLPVNMPSALKCPKCKTDMVVRQKKNNADELYISCMSYPNCKNAVWLPSLVKTIQVLPNTCPTCGPNYKMLKFEWRNNQISHLYPPPYTGCIGGCDMTFLEMLRINPSSVRPVSETRNQVAAQPQNAINSNRPQSVNSRTNNNSANTIPVAQVRANPRSNTTTTAQPRQFLPPPTVNRNQNTMNNQPRMPTPRSSDGDNNILCGCNQPAILLTVRKQNANHGKQFYKCQTGKDNGGCDFFLWAPENDSSVQNPYDTPPTSTWESNDTSSTTRGWGITPSNPRSSGGNNDEVMCDCGIPCKRLIAQKEGPNKGRPFHVCVKDIATRCKFFQWADSETVPGN
ncbi:hypothetical protein HF086_011241 [Spodoptera exigua]|uniref:DNA topoisomerase n=1 Tax=Spodoptera exigua TaxID=7107 RepID=A0A922MHA0_SPOEX|nr:hypothetical protein HF086_011241 [Spodoptera exigua]